MIRLAAHISQENRFVWLLGGDQPMRQGWDIGARPPVPDRRTGARAECPSACFEPRCRAHAAARWRVRAATSLAQGVPPDPAL